VRLQTSLDAIRLPNPLPASKWTELVGKIIAGNPWEDQNVYLQITRGAAKRDHVFPKGVKPTVFMMASELVPPTAELVKSGAKAIVLPDFRWLRCDIKSVSLLGNCMQRTLAADQGCAEAILIRDGMLTEASASNVFVVKDGTVLAPPKSHLILPGITYDVVLEILRENSIAHEVRPVTEAELRSAEEVWVTSSSREVLAITTLDGKPVGGGKPGPVGERVHALYQQYKAKVMRAPIHA
jgi:D-alanine transaminase